MKSLLRLTILVAGLALLAYPQARADDAVDSPPAKPDTATGLWDSHVKAYDLDPETGEVAAFEELIGSHGGLGGAQTKPFLVHPAEWEMDLAPLLGAPMVYQQLRRWMEDELGMTFGLTKRPEDTGSSSGAD